MLLQTISIALRNKALERKKNCTILLRYEENYVDIRKIIN